MVVEGSNGTFWVLEDFSGLFATSQAFIRVPSLELPLWLVSGGERAGLLGVVFC